jgi:hypothetical protein
MELLLAARTEIEFFSLLAKLAGRYEYGLPRVNLAASESWSEPGLEISLKETIEESPSRVYQKITHRFILDMHGALRWEITDGDTIHGLENIQQLVRQHLNLDIQVPNYTEPHPDNE